MHCLKCGAEISVEQCFCEACLADMGRHPVQPGTPLILPKRDKLPPSKRIPRKVRKPEDLIVSQRRLIGWLLATIIILVIGVVLLTFAMLHFREMTDLYANTIDGIVSRETIFDKL